MRRIAGADLMALRERARDWFEALRDRICAALERI
jgi:hypothetical protein